ncbi:MAG: 1-acyl-sn-glycerol-3-phosphate acyltransferase [Pseudomonadota bacterium]
MSHIVDQLIEERARGLRARPMLWGTVRRFLYPVLGYRDAIRMIDTLRPYRGTQVFRWLSRRLRMRVEVTGVERLPRNGLVIAVANHPAGIADGVAVWDALKSRRQDLCFFANRDAVRAVPGLADMIIPIEWQAEQRSRERSKETVKVMLRAFKAEQLVVIFPSGRLAQPTLRGLRERPWMPTAMSLAQKYRAPVVPIHIEGRSSWLYYLFYFLSDELRDITLFRELLNKTRQRYRVSVGFPFEPIGDATALTRDVREFVTERMPRGARRFAPEPADAGTVAATADQPSDS